MRTSIVLACLSALCVGCTVLGSDSPLDLQRDDRPANGVYYTLPKGIVNLTLLGNDAGQFDLQVSDPVFGPDSAHRYFLRYKPHPSYDDDIVISMNDSGRPFLKSIRSKATDKTKDVFVDLAKAAGFGGGFQAFAVENARLLAQVPFDPTDPSSVSATRDQIGDAMYRFAKEQRRQCTRTPPAANDGDGKAACYNFAHLLAKHDAHRLGKTNGEPLFSLSVAAPPKLPAGPAPDCSVGICYRAKVPYLIDYSVAGVTDTKVVELPNGGDPVVIDISRAFLVKRFQEFDFDDDGFLTRVKVEKDSELLAAAKLPTDVLAAFSEGLQLRIKFTEQNKERANTQAELIKKRAKLRKDQQDHLAEKLRAVEKQKTQSIVPTVFANTAAAQPPPSGTAPPLDPNLQGDSR